MATYHRQPFHFSGCWASLPWLCHYLVEQYHSWAFELILDIVHVMSHFTCISTVSIQKWETTHTDFWKALTESALQRLVLFTCHLQSDSAAHPQHPCQRWYSDATLGHCGLPNYIKLTYESISWLCFLIFVHYDHAGVRTSPVSISPSSVTSSLVFELIWLCLLSWFSMLFSSRIYWFCGGFCISSQNSFLASDQDSNPPVFFFLEVLMVLLYSSNSASHWKDPLRF